MCSSDYNIIWATEITDLLSVEALTSGSQTLL